jgi:hypothetical protein
MSNIIHLPIGIQGFFKLEAVNKFSGKRRILADWFPNQILDTGRNVMSELAAARHNGWAGVSSSAQVGTDGTVPVAGDSQLIAWIDGTSDVQSSVFGAQPSAPYYGWNRTTYRFPAGPIGNQNLQEAAVGWGEGPGADIITRALIVDGVGTPTPAVPLADELLDLWYELRYYPPLGDTLGTVTLNGVGYDTITRAALVTTWGDRIGESMGTWNGGAPINWGAYSGDIGATIDLGPSGTLTPNDNEGQFNLAYNNNSYEIDMQCNAGPTGWNVGTGIRSILITCNGCKFQTQFNADGTGGSSVDDPIPKDINFTMQLTWRLGWDAAVIP